MAAPREHRRVPWAGTGRLRVRPYRAHVGCEVVSSRRGRRGAQQGAGDGDTSVSTAENVATRCPTRVSFPGVRPPTGFEPATPANGSRALPHNKYGEADSAANHLLRRALATGSFEDAERIPLGRDPGGLEPTPVRTAAGSRAAVTSTRSPRLSPPAATWSAALAYRLRRGGPAGRGGRHRHPARGQEGAPGGRGLHPRSFRRHHHDRLTSVAPGRPEFRWCGWVSSERRCPCRVTGGSLGPAGNG